MGLIDMMLKNLVLKWDNKKKWYVPIYEEEQVSR